ncbi:MAG: hypothetical protein LBI48_11445 [Burkholderiaceae bacterium]|jgi:uncharacterized cupin superfamily protein|nr:hypothetical protein [Burkholderiaceae bacterium]
MNKFNYARTAASAVRLIGKFGASAMLRRKSGAQYDPATSSVVDTWQEWPCTVAVVDYTAKDIDGTLILAGDRRLLVAPDIATVPKAGDVFVFQDWMTTVIRVKTTAPAGTAVLHDVQARGQ